MFVQATKSRRQNKTYVSYLVRESFRTSQGPRSRTVSNISALPPEVRDLVAAALSGKTCVALEQIELSSALDYGGLAVLRDAWQRFAMESSTLNLETMRKEDLHFVTRLSAATLREVIAQLPQNPQPQLWDRTKLIELTLEGNRYVIAGGEHRQQRDLARRRARLEKAESELKRLAAIRRKKPNPQKLASQVGRTLPSPKHRQTVQSG